MVRNKTNKNKSKMGSSSFCPKNENVSTNRFGSLSVYSSSSPDDEQVTQQVSEREKNSKSFEDEDVGDVDAGEKFEQVQNKKDKEIQKKIEFVNEEYDKFFRKLNSQKERVLKELDKNVKFSVEDICLKTDEALENNMRTIGDEAKKRSMGREYSEVELFDESKDYMKRGRLLESSEFLWFTFSCAVSRLFAKLKIDITSHVATNILTNCLINACKGRKSIIDTGRKRANAAHRASYSVVVLEKLKGQILVMEDFIEEMNNIKLNDVKKSFEELKNEDDQLSDMNFGTCKIYNNKHTAFVFGASFDFDFSADIVNSKKYSVKN